VLGYTILFIAAALLRWLSWIGYCMYVLGRQPTRAAEIIQASGKSYPFRRWPRRKGSDPPS
jgi:hypothetical protein